jgi:hypothetical protein
MSAPAGGSGGRRQSGLGVASCSTIAEKADAAERRADFADVAEQRYAGIVASRKTISWPEMRRYLEDRIAGKKAKRRTARKLAR